MKESVVKSPLSESDSPLYFRAWWMEPSGNLHQLYKTPGFGHWDFAVSQLRKFGVASNDVRMQQPMSSLLDKGWFKLTWNYYKDGALHYSYSKNRPIPNEKIMSLIKSLAIEIHAKKLVDDNWDKEQPLLEENYNNRIPIVVGIILTNGEIKSKETTANHQDIGLDSAYGKKWRYNPKSQITYWWTAWNDIEKGSVTDYLQHEYNYKVRGNVCLPYIEQHDSKSYFKYFNDAHGNVITESMFPKGFDRNKLGSCMLAAEYATKYFLAKGIVDFKIIEGFVSFGDDWDLESDGDEVLGYGNVFTHTWIEFSDGRKFDPTRNQWKNWKFNPNEAEFHKEKGKEYSPKEYLELCQHGESLTEIKNLNEIEGNEPDIYYHVTFKDLVPKIKKQGLKPQSKPTWAGADDVDVRETAGLFCFDNYYDAIQWAFRTSWHIKGRIPVIVKFKDIDKDFVPDTHWQSSGAIGEWLVKQSSVKPENILSYEEFTSDDFTPELVKKINSFKKLNENVDWHKHATFEAYVYRNPENKTWHFWFWRNNRPAGEILSIEKDGHMWGFAVQRSLQGTGVGKAMLYYAFEKTGLGYFTLDSTANSFYHKIGGKRVKHPYHQKRTRFVIQRDKLKPSEIKFQDKKTSPTKSRNEFHGRSGFNGQFDAWPSINENTESLNERLSYADLYDATDDKRIEKSKKVRVQPLLVTTENNNEVWKFSYSSAERTEFKDTGRVGHKGNIYFFKDNIEPNDNAEDLDCMVDCDCKDFKFRWAYVNAQNDASFIGAKSLNKAINRPPIKTNPERKTQLCKHLAGLAKYLTTNIDRARQRAHLRRRPVNIFETMDKLAGQGKFTTTYNDDYNIKECVEPPPIVKEEIKIEEPIFENLQKLGFSPHDEHPAMPINWHSIDLFSDHPWSIPSIKRLLGLSDKFSAIYPATIEVNTLNYTLFADMGQWEEFEKQKGGFPPIIVVRESNGRLIIADGNHRVKWAKKSGYKTIGAWVVDKMIQDDLDRRKPIKETRIIQPEEALEEGYITLYHGTTWPIALKAKKGELGPQNLRSLVSNVLVNVFHEKPQDAVQIYDTEIKKNSIREEPSRNLLFLTTDKDTAERYAKSATKYGGEIFMDILMQYIWDKNRNTSGNISQILQNHLLTDQPAIVTINVPLSMVFTHPNWNTPFRNRIRVALKNVRKNPTLRKYINDMNIEVFVSEKVPAKFVQRIDKVNLHPEKR